jgi:hypothetical protein
MQSTGQTAMQAWSRWSMQGAAITKAIGMFLGVTGPFIGRYPY